MTGIWPFATLTIKINNMCCKDMQKKFEERELGYDFVMQAFCLGRKDRLITHCPWCGGYLEQRRNTNARLMIY